MITTIIISPSNIILFDTMKFTQLNSIFENLTPDDFGLEDFILQDLSKPLDDTKKHFSSVEIGNKI